jgi:hypothetical protein
MPGLSYPCRSFFPRISRSKICILTSRTVLWILFICVWNNVNDCSVIEFCKDDNTHGKNTHHHLQKNAQVQKTRVCFAFLTPQRKSYAYLAVLCDLSIMHVIKFNQVRAAGLDMRTKVSKMTPGTHVPCLLLLTWNGWLELKFGWKNCS